MEEKLFDEFQEVSAKAWKQKIQYELKGADYNDNLVWESPEGIKVKPFYHLDDLHSIDLNIPYRPTSWKIAQEIFVAYATKSNKKALNALQRGAESLIFTIPSEHTDFEKLLANIDLDLVNLHFNFQFLSTSYIKKLLKFLEGYKSNSYLNLDTLGHLASTGNWYSQEDQDTLSEILNLAKGQENRNVLSVDLAIYQNAGANIVQQLAYALAHINEYLNLYGHRVVFCPVFKISVGGNYFFEIAKIRALRKLWGLLASEYDMSSDCHIMATPSKRNKTLYGYNINMLRTTSECMAAILGGADTVCNLPYDAIYHKDNEFGERIARNQLVLLKNESYLDRIDNPAEGSYYIEALTEEIAKKALQLFKNIESQGGFAKQLKSHTIQKKIRESAQKEQQHFDAAKEILVGTNAYESSEDLMKDNLEMYPFVKKNARKTVIEPIIESRLSEKIERKRLKDEGWIGN